MQEVHQYVNAYVLFALGMGAKNTVTGTVLDESNLEVIGANVKEKGTANGAITDMNGVFHLKVSNLQKAVLQISFMGYEPQEVPLNGRKQLKIILKETANELQEVTVVAYGTQKERNSDRSYFCCKQ